MNQELDTIHDPRDARIEQLERRIRYCEEVARQYQTMYEQLQRELKTLADRQGNIQAVYDYMTKVGSTIATKKKDRIAFLNKDTSKLDKKGKFSIGEKVFYADERNQRVTATIVDGVDWLNINDKYPRYIVKGFFGYVQESKLFATKDQAQDQLNEWNRDACNRY